MLATFAIGDEVLPAHRPGKKIKIDARRYEAVMRMRSVLLVVAQRCSTIRYSQLAAAIDFLYPHWALTEALDALHADCLNRGEPSLASMVVRASTGEVASGFPGDPGREREPCYLYHRFK